MLCGEAGEAERRCAYRESQASLPSQLGPAGCYRQAACCSQRGPAAAGWF